MAPVEVVPGASGAGPGGGLLNAPGGTSRPTFSILAVASCLAAAWTAPVEAQEHRVSGEYGLWVAERDGQVHVAWLTEGPEPGVLEVLQVDERVHHVETPADRSHRASFPRPGDGPLVLRYGALDESSPHGGGLHTTTVHLSAEAARPASVLTGVDSLFLVGDVHGEYDTLVQLLRNAGLVDERGRWSGGRKHVAFLGDLFDRGADVTRTLWFLYRLEHEAAAAGGGSHVILGNHETMVFTGDLRYVSTKEDFLATLHGTTYERLFDLRESVLGRWLGSRPGLMKIDRALLAHGGVAPRYARYGVEEFNDSLRTFLADDLIYYLGPILSESDSTAALVPDSSLVDLVDAEHVVVMDSATVQRRLDFIFDEASVFWFRDYLATDTLGTALAEVLERHDADVHVVAHTPVIFVQARYDGQLFAVDMEDAATEMLLLERDGDGAYQAWRFGLEGPPQTVPGAS